MAHPYPDGYGPDAIDLPNANDLPDDVNDLPEDAIDLSDGSLDLSDGSSIPRRLWT